MHLQVEIVVWQGIMQVRSEVTVMLIHVEYNKCEDCNDQNKQEILYHVID